MKRFRAIKPITEQASNPEVLATSGVAGGGGPAITDPATNTNATVRIPKYVFEFFMFFLFSA